MSVGRHIDLDCGIAYSRIANWLDNELALERQHENGPWLYQEDNQTCSIYAEPLESRTLSMVAIERTHLVASGDDEALASFEKAFTLRFISAGG